MFLILYNKFNFFNSIFFFFREKPEFILVAQKERIIRLSLNKPFEVLPVRKLENVIAVEFDVQNNCVFWADIVTDTIGVYYFAFNLFSIFQLIFFFYIATMFI